MLKTLGVDHEIEFALFFLAMMVCAQYWAMEGGEMVRW